MSPFRRILVTAAHTLASGCPNIASRRARPGSVSCAPDQSGVTKKENRPAHENRALNRAKLNFEQGQAHPCRSSTGTQLSVEQFLYMVSRVPVAPVVREPDED
jgi:hypothetical protein